MQRAPLVVVAVLLASTFVASPAVADGPLHVKAVQGPYSATYAAGTFCDFTFHTEYTVTINVKRFDGADGRPDHAVRQEDLRAIHTNVDTGLTYTEETHYTLLLSNPFFYPSGRWYWQDVTSSGQNWALRDVDGTMVLVRAGRYVEDLNTGEILWSTPWGDPALAQTICTALGGAAAQ